MKKTGILISVLFISLTLVLLSGCRNEEGPASVAFTLKEIDLIPEGITFDPLTNQFFVSSIGKEKIVSVMDHDKVIDFVGSGKDSIMETLGMKVDADRRRLWVVSNKKRGNVNNSAVHIYNIDSGKLINKIVLRDTAPMLFNDLVLAKNGDAYITDSYGSRIYHVGAEADRLELFEGPDTLLAWVNGIAVSPDDKILYLASGAHITTIDIETREIKPIGDPNRLGSNGLDGIVYHDRSLIGVMNTKDTENEMFIVKYGLSPDFKEIKSRTIIDKGNPLFNLPTTCVIAGDELYVLGNTSLRLYFQDKTNAKGLFKKPLILRYSIDN
jgi:hypothetical protein